MRSTGAIWFARWEKPPLYIFVPLLFLSHRRLFLLRVTHLVTNENCQPLKSNYLSKISTSLKESEKAVPIINKALYEQESAISASILKKFFHQDYL